MDSCSFPDVQQVLFPSQVQRMIQWRAVKPWAPDTKALTRFLHVFFAMCGGF